MKTLLAAAVLVLGVVPNADATCRSAQRVCFNSHQSFSHGHLNFQSFAVPVLPFVQVPQQYSYPAPVPYQAQSEANAAAEQLGQAIAGAVQGFFSSTQAYSAPQVAPQAYVQPAQVYALPVHHQVAPIVQKNVIVKQEVRHERRGLVSRMVDAHRRRQVNQGFRAAQNLHHH